MKLAKRFSNSSKKRGFSLTELIIVIVIMGILMAAVFLGGSNSISSAKESQVKSDLRNMSIYVENMMNSNPDLQFSDKVVGGEYFTYDPKTSKYTQVGVNNGAATSNLTAIDDAVANSVLKLLNGDYLTSDFQMGEIKDAWENPYCYSYNQIPSTGTGKSSSCVVVINSLGVNATDETSNGAANGEVAAITDIDAVKAGTEALTAGSGKSVKVAKAFETAMKADTDSQKAFDSAEAFVDALDVDNDKLGDDYGVVIVMIDGAVSTAYYGF